MKRILLLLGFVSAIGASAQNGYEIKVTFKPFKNQFIYLGHYFGKQYPIIDSAKLDANSQAIFKGPQKLPGGIYLIGYPNKAGFFEIMVDKQQQFSVLADTLTMKKGVQFLNSPDNTLFDSYHQYMAAKGKEITDAQQQYKNATTAKDSASWSAVVDKLDKSIKAYRDDLIKKNPDYLLSKLLVAMREPEMPAALQNPKTKADSAEAYYYYKNHYWDGVDFWDGRLAYTTFFEDKLDKYYNQVVALHPDSVIKEMDRMLGFASINQEMNKYMLLKFVNRYLNQKYMWEDAIFVHLFEKYFSSKNYPWLTPQGKKTITERAYSLMANILGTPATDIELPDSTGAVKTLYGDSAAYTIVCFWDPTCGHCKETLPKLDSMYQSKWKASGLKIFAIARETDGTKKDWLDFINTYQLKEWTNVYYTKTADKARTDAGIPGYSQLYDVLTFPTLYLLDKEKRIVAKKLSLEQIDEVLKVKMKDQ